MIERLFCEIRDYAWGDPEAIPRLLGVSPSGEPQAEMWMGAHPGAPSHLVCNGRSLHDVIADNPTLVLGEGLAAQGLELPFLCKFLAAAEPLSIQAHPNADQALSGFLREEKLQIAIDDPIRTYRDKSHKPELLVALEPFRALCGFRAVSETVRILAELQLPELDEMLRSLSGPEPDSEILATTVRWLLALPAAQVKDWIAALRLGVASTTVSSSDAVSSSGALGPLSWVPEVADRYPDDAGVLVALLLNPVLLQPGEAVFLCAGNVHAYLSGLGIEVMANSDNVIRGGLTKKNVDIDELLAVANFTPIDAPVQSPVGADHLYHAPVSDFSLHRIELGGPAQDHRDLQCAGPELVVVTEGQAALKGRSGASTTLVGGQVAFVSADEGSYRLQGDGLVWRITVGL